MMIEPKRTEQVTLRVTTKMRDDIEDIATKHEATISEVLRFALSNLTTK